MTIPRTEPARQAGGHAHAGAGLKVPSRPGAHPATKIIYDDGDALFSVSDERDVQLELRHRAWRDGYTEATGEQWSAGYAAAISDVKSTQRQMYDAVQRAAARLAPSGAAWLDAVQRHDGTEFGGTGRPRVPVDPAVIDAARRGGPA